jgi:Domain of unknown function (DUF5127)/Domain of unknown function (DUF4965)/Domain of unknown function (DUF1793)/Domain of unknown function (DUF4964)
MALGEAGMTDRDAPRRDLRQGSGTDGDGPRRRDFLRYSGAAVAGGTLAGGAIGVVGAGPAAAGTAGLRTAATAAGTAGSAAGTAAAGSGAAGTVAAGGELVAVPVRPPAAALAVRGPYLSTWLPATTLPGTWPQFWTGHITAMAGIVRVDGTSYMFMGAPALPLPVPNGNSGSQSTVSGFERALRQTRLEVTATRSRFTLQGGGVGLVAEFFSPVEPGDLRRQSIPMSYVVLTVQSVDGAAHDVQVYMDISGEWTSGDVSQVINWAPYSDSSLRAWSVQLASQQPLTEQGQLAAWGSVVWSTPAASGLSYQSGQDIVVRGGFVANGSLPDTSDTNYRAISDNWPVFAFCRDLGRVGGSPVTVPLAIGQVRSPAVSYLGQDLKPLWSSYFSGWQDMAGFFLSDLAAASSRADKLDGRVNGDATAAGGQEYAGLCALALRQAYGGTELVAGPGGQPWAFLKEISSDGNVSTVDVVYPASPAWIYADPAYLGLLLEPLLAYAETGGWPKPFAEHDLGSAYPVASGHNNGQEEDMPVEESGNMLIMAAAYIKQAPSFAAAHYKILKQWADYLVANLPDPGFQNQTDDFAGSIAHSVNLALKGIIAVAAMAQIAKAAGNSADAAYYSGQAGKFIGYWVTNAQDPSGKHLDLTYNGSGGGDGTWGTTYNGFADRLLGTGLIPAPVLAEQAAWYASAGNEFGLPLQVPHSYAKSDWEMWTAAWLSGYPVKQQLIGQVYTYANTTPSRVPFSDLYDTISDQQVAFQARPVQGGMFALLALGKHG